jgi:hypothetical protein
MSELKSKETRAIETEQFLKRYRAHVQAHHLEGPGRCAWEMTRLGFDPHQADGYRGRRLCCCAEGTCFSVAGTESKVALPQPSITSPPTAPQSRKSPMSTNIEDTIKLNWNSDAKLRADFGDDLKAYSAYMRANAQGLVRIHGSGTAGREEQRS